MTTPLSLLADLAQTVRLAISPEHINALAELDRIASAARKLDEARPVEPACASNAVCSEPGCPVRVDPPATMCDYHARREPIDEDGRDLWTPVREEPLVNPAPCPHCGAKDCSYADHGQPASYDAMPPKPAASEAHKCGACGVRVDWPSGGYAAWDHPPLYTTLAFLEAKLTAALDRATTAEQQRDALREAAQMVLRHPPSEPVSHDIVNALSAALGKDGGR